MSHPVINPVRLLRFFFLSLCLTGPLFGPASVTAQAQDQGLQWPLGLAPALSSTFGETRSTAFHAGIDLKTWGKTGYAVHAAGDGWVERARMSPWGFGRAIYVRLTDGRIAVYAHLDSFFTPIQERIRAEQRAQGHYSVQLWFEKGEIPVKRGQVIAATGQTGAGPPHLHFELRDSGNVPLNALLHAFRVADTQAPTIRRLLVVPRGPGSLADGGHDPVMVPVRWQTAQQRFVATRPVSVFGRIGIGVESFDTADAADNKMAPLWQALRVDDQEVFRSRLHRVPIADWHQVSLDRWRLNGHVFSNLFLRPGNRLPFYTSDGNAGWIFAGGDGLPPGEHHVEVIAADVAGNESLATLRLNVAASYGVALNGGHAEERRPAARSAGSDSPSVELIPYERFAVLRVSGARSGQAVATTGAERPIALEPQGDGFVGLVSYAHASDGSGVAAVGVRFKDATVDSVLQLSTQAIRPGQAQRLEYHEGLVVLHLDAGSAYEEIVPQVTPKRSAVSPGLRATHLAADLRGSGARGSGVSGSGVLGFDVQPQTVSFDKWARISFPVPDERDPTKLGVYVSDGDGGWVFIGNDVDGNRGGANPGASYEDADPSLPRTDDTTAHGRRVSARIRAFGHFALLEDVAPPTVSALAPRSRAWIDDRRPVLRARVVDHGSGIGEEAALVIELNGQPLIHIYDPEADMLEARPDAPLPDGEYVWTVRARDRSGNETEVSDVFGLR
jgi:murein DD-endopeptidase MepM/ murein hydrolase activator NlpD